MHRRTRLILIFLAAVVVIGGLLWTALRPVPVPVQMVEAMRAPMQVTVNVDGTTRIREVFEVSAPITGTAKRSPVRVGDPVAEAVTVVARVEPVAPSLLDARSRQQAEAAVHEAQAALEVADSQLVQAEAQVVYTQGQYDRVKELVGRGVASSVQLEDAAQLLNIHLAARDAARSSRVMALSALERARAALIGPESNESDSLECCIELKAPADGVVLSIARVSERPVMAGETLLSIGDPDALEIVANLLSRDAVGIPEDARATVDRWGGDAKLEAKLRQIAPSAHTDISALGIEEQRVEAVFDLVTPMQDGDALGNGYSLRLAIVVWEENNVLQVPLGALFRDGPDWSVLFVKDGIAQKGVVTLGRRNDKMAQITSGLAEGDMVIVHPGDAVVEGSLVQSAM